MKTTILPSKNLMNRSPLLAFLLISFVLACFAFSPTAQAVDPPPDGGYSGENTAEGEDALFSLVPGAAGNTALGWRSLFSDTTGSFNTGVGAGALILNNADSNTAVGAVALLLNTSGTENVAVGTDALVFNDSGLQNVANGAFALFNNTTGSHNTAVGSNALFQNTASSNTGIGDDALQSNITGQFNVAMGDSAGANSTGDNNVIIGTGAGNNITTASNVICISTSGENVSNTCYIANIFSATNAGGSAVFVNGDGQLHTMTSSKRFKEDIKPINDGSKALFALKPVTFRYKKDIDPAGTAQLGLVAEDVEKVNPDLVVHDKEGKPYSVRYDQVNAMLLNEFLKEHREVQELRKQVAVLTAGLQRVTARLELSKSAPQTVVNDQ